MRRILLAIVLAVIARDAWAVQFTGVQTSATTWTYTLTYDPYDNYSQCQPGATITVSGLTGVTAAGAPTASDHPEPASQLSWTTQVLNGGTTVVWTKTNGGTGNYDRALHVFGFTITAPGVRSGEASVTTNGFVRDTPCPSLSRDIGVSVVGPTGVKDVYRVLPVVGSVSGAQGSQFKTSVQMFNPQAYQTLEGKIVFHVQGVTGSSSDPSLPYSIPPGRTLSIDNLLPAIGLSSGLGSADIVPTLGTVPPPVVDARVFNDAGAAGTSGLLEAALDPAEALQKGASGILLAPADTARARLNVGIRTLGNGVTLDITVRSKIGVVVKTVSKSYPATYFTQPSSAALLDGYTLSGGETLTFAVMGGSAFIYGSTTDNTTNDPAIAFARPVK